MRRLWKVVSIAAVVMLMASAAWAANSLEVVSQTGQTGGATVEVRAKLTNDLSMKSIVIPLVIRQVGTATISDLTLRWRDRLPQAGGAALSEIVVNEICYYENGHCKAGAAGGFNVQGPAGACTDSTCFDTLSHPVSALPVGAFMFRNKIFGASLAAGADVDGSILLIMTMGNNDGCVVVDTTCVDPANHLLYKADNNSTPPVTFSAGVACVGACSVGAVDEGSMFPAAGTADNDTVSYAWDPVQGATSYTIQIGFDANLSSILTEATVSTPAFDYVVPGTEASPVDTYWRVRANLAGACSSDWTNAFKFTDVKNVTGEVIPETYKLSQNYPNPFNAGTVIDFTMKNSGHAKLEVFNILGQSVVTLVDDEKSAGVYSVSWDGKDSRGHSVPSGMYFYRLSTNQFKEVKKMTLLK